MKSNTAAVVLIGAFLLGACGGDDSSGTSSTSEAPTDATSSASASASDASQGGVIPDGTYERVVRRDDAIAAGFEPGLVDHVLGPDGELPLTFKIVGDRWTQFAVLDDGSPDLGDKGTQYIDEDGHLVQVSESEGGFGSEFVLDWSLQDDELTWTCLSGCTRDDPPDATANLVVEGTWLKTS